MVYQATGRPVSVFNSSLEIIKTRLDVHHLHYWLKSALSLIYKTKSRGETRFKRIKADLDADISCFAGATFSLRLENGL